MSIILSLSIMWHCGVDVPNPLLSYWTRLQWALHSLIVGIWHSNFLDVGTEIEIHNNSLLGKVKIDSFYLDIVRNIGNFHFSVVPVGTLGATISS